MCSDTDNASNTKPESGIENFSIPTKGKQTSLFNCLPQLHQQSSTYQIFFAAFSLVCIAMVISTLFEHIIIEHILTRLPVKSLLRFRCVCKSWEHILSNPDPQFITTHITHTSQNPEYEYLIMAIQKLAEHGFGIQTRYSIDLIGRSRLSYTTLDNAPMYGRIVGSINGLVCLNYRYLFLLWNPVTGFGKTITPPEDYYRNKNLIDERFYGFGWDYVESEFKVVVCYRRRESLQAFVYTSSSDLWNVLVVPDTLSGKVFEKHPAIIVKGCPFWTAATRYRMFAVKFESRSNQFKEFLLPSQITRNYTLTNVKDCLTMMVYDAVPGRLVYVFHLDEECGVWSKTYTFGPIYIYTGALLQCFKYGDEVVFDNGKMLYDPKTNGIKVIGDGFWGLFGGCSYTPSLAFLPGMEPLHMQSHWRPPEEQLLTPAQSHMRILFGRFLDSLRWR